MGSWGLRVSKPGDNVETVEDKLVQFSTKYSTLKVYAEAQVNFTTNGAGAGSLTVAHGLGFAPAFYVFNKATYQDSFYEGTSYPNCYFPIGIWSEFEVYTDSTNLYIGGSGLSANTTYYFKYYILMDLAEDFSGSQLITLENNYGFKVSKPGTDVTTAKEYQLAYSSKYKSLQYYDVSFKTGSMSLPGFTNSVVDPQPRAGTYIDITHGLGYAPFFLVFYHSSLMADANQYQELPFQLLHGDDTTSSQYYAWANSTKVRVIFEKMGDPLLIPTTEQEETVSIKVYVFTENLSI